MPSLSDIWSWAILIGFSLLCLALLIAIILGGIWLSVILYRKILVHLKAISTARAEIAKTNAISTQIADVGKNNSLVARKRLGKLASDLMRSQIQEKHELNLLEKQGRLKAQGILSRAHEITSKAIEMSAKQDERANRERSELERKITTLHDLNTTLANENSTLKAKAEHDQVEIRHLRDDRERINAENSLQRESTLSAHAQEKEALLQAAAAEKDLLNNQIADLRSYLAAKEGSEPTMKILMDMAKSFDDLRRDMKNPSTTTVAETST